MAQATTFDNSTNWRHNVGWLAAGLVLAVLAARQSNAAIISMNSTSMQARGVATNLVGQQLEDDLNEKVFGPLGMELEVASPTGGTTAVDDLAFEGPGLTIIGGSGFILRWLTAPADPVVFGFSDYKDDGARSVYAYDFSADYVRDPLQTSQSASGKVIANPSQLAAIETAEGALDNESSIFLSVGGAPISSVWVRTNRFLTSWTQVEFTAVPEPPTFTLFTFGTLGVFWYGCKRRR